MCPSTIERFASANRSNEPPFRQSELVCGLAMLANEEMNTLFPAAAEATEETILNSMTNASPMMGVRGTIVQALPLPELVEFRRYGRSPGTRLQ
jgi:L-aminopeptidase/D-esterase-like protein